MLTTWVKTLYRAFSFTWPAAIPEKTADIPRYHQWFQREMTSEERGQKFHTTQIWIVLLTGGSKFSTRHNQSEALTRGAFLWDDLDQDQWSEITRIMVDQYWTDESTVDKDSSVHLIYHDPSDLGSLILIRIIPNERTPDLGSDTSSVWSFCACFSDSGVISQGNQWWSRRKRRLFSQATNLSEQKKVRFKFRRIGLGHKNHRSSIVLRFNMADETSCKNAL